MILVDDLLHKGYRIKEIDPILKRYNINVKKIIVGIMSGRGKDLKDTQGKMCIRDRYTITSSQEVQLAHCLKYPLTGQVQLYKLFVFY